MPDASSDWGSAVAAEPDTHLPLRNSSKCRAEVAIAIHQDIFLIFQETVKGIGQVSGDLLHEVITQRRHPGSKVNATCFQLRDEQEIERHQSTFRPDLNRREVDRGQYVPMRSKKRLLVRLSFPVRSRLDSMLFENVAHGLVGNLMAKICQRTLNPIITPQRGFTCYP